MDSKILVAICRLSRVDTCILAFLTVFAPSYVHDKNFAHSFFLALPVFLMCVCAFIINDVNDIEKDAINHPDRPLPKRRLTIGFAIALYFLLVLISLVLVKMYVPLSYVFTYLVFLILLTNYNYLVDTFPHIKNLYVATTTIMPIIILSYVSPGDYGYASVAGALMFFVFGREMLMDVLDSMGDGRTLIKIIGTRLSIVVAFVLQWVGALFLLGSIQNIVDVYVVSVFVLSLGLLHWLWGKSYNKHKLIDYMKIQMLIGMCLLF